MSEVNFRDQGFRENPHPIYVQLRRNAPVAKVNGLDAYLITQHADCEALLKNPKVVLQEYSADSFAPGHPLQSYFQLREGLMLFSNKPRHTELRKPSEASFRAGAVKTYEAMIRALAQEQISFLQQELSHGRTVDFTTQISIPFVSKVICHIVGIPDQDHDKLSTLTQQVADGLDPLGPKHSLENAGKAYLEFRDYMQTELKKGRWREQAEEFTGTFLSEISQCPHMLRGFQSTEDLIATTVMLLSGGHLTTNHSLSLSLTSFYNHTEKRVLNEHITSLLIEELFRFHSPVHTTRRMLMEETTIAGTQFKKGQALWLSLASANRDERIFQSPQQLNFQRKPNPHLAFGGGIHFCLGTHLARLQLRVFLEELSETKLPIQLGETVSDNNLVFRGMKRLQLV